MTARAPSVGYRSCYDAVWDTSFPVPYGLVGRSGRAVTGQGWDEEAGCRLWGCRADRELSGHRDWQAGADVSGRSRVRRLLYER